MSESQLLSETLATFLESCGYDHHLRNLRKRYAAQVDEARALIAEAQKLSHLPFSREITKKEQADMGALKKSARGLIVVHPMTALGREMGLKAVTGYAKKAF